MTVYPNQQSNPSGAIPVWMAGPGATAGLAYLGYQQITDLSTVQTLTLPAGTVTLAVIMPENGNIRWLIDADPTGSVGMIIWGTSQFNFMGDFDGLRMINEGTGTAKANIAYYGVAPS